MSGVAGGNTVWILGADMSTIYPAPKPLSREFVLKSILHILDTVPVVKGWGSWQISYQNGIWKTIEEKKTTTEEK
jgi:hypothetical protein